MLHRVLTNEAQGFRSTPVVIEERGYQEAEITDCPQSRQSHSLPCLHYLFLSTFCLPSPWKWGLCLSCATVSTEP